MELDLSPDIIDVADVIKVLAEKGDEWRHVLDPQRLTITVNK